MYDEDKPPVFTLADRGTGDRYVLPAKAADVSKLRLLLADRKEESLTVYTDSFRAYEPLHEDDAFDRDTSSTAMSNTPTETYTSIPARVRIASDPDLVVEAAKGLDLWSR